MLVSMLIPALIGNLKIIIQILKITEPMNIIRIVVTTLILIITQIFKIINIIIVIITTIVIIWKKKNTKDMKELRKC